MLAPNREESEKMTIPCGNSSFEGGVIPGGAALTLAVADSYLRIGIAAAHLAKLSSRNRDFKFGIEWGKLTAGSLMAGTAGVEPTAYDWEELVLMCAEVQEVTH